MIKATFTTGLVTLLAGLTMVVLPTETASAAEVRKAKVGKEFTYSEWCWERPGETQLQIKQAGSWTAVDTQQVAEDEGCDPEHPYSATLTWTPTNAGTLKAREFRPASDTDDAVWRSFTLKVAEPAPIKVKLGKRFKYDYCLPEPGTIKLQVKSGGRWKTVDTTDPLTDVNECEDPEYPYSATLWWKPSKPGTFTLRDYQSATETTEEGSYGTYRVKVTRPASSGGGSTSWDDEIGVYAGTTGFCNDGWISTSIGKSGACSHHGGVAGGSSGYTSSIGSTYVSGYYRSNGTYVHGYYRR